jgi:hypothetical protein
MIAMSNRVDTRFSKIPHNVRLTRELEGEAKGVVRVNYYSTVLRWLPEMLQGC